MLSASHVRLHVTMATIGMLPAQAAVMRFNIETILPDVSPLLSIQT